MDRKNDEISRLLAEPTRLEIYRAVIGAGGKTMTSAEISRKFSLHVNVARMHLEKLAGAGLLLSSYRKTVGGGRPPREYSAGNKLFTFQYPPRDYQLLADISLATLQNGRDAETVAREAGHRIGEKAVAAAGLKPGTARDKKLVASLKKLIEGQGLLARVATSADGGLEVRAFNCIFKELSSKYANLVCGIHRQLFTGLCESHFGKVEVTSDFEIVEGGQSCKFMVIQIS
jgi:predicted ArsR family transcriptional regulator